MSVGWNLSPNESAALVESMETIADGLFIAIVIVFVCIAGLLIYNVIRDEYEERKERQRRDESHRRRRLLRQQRDSVERDLVRQAARVIDEANRRSGSNQGITQNSSSQSYSARHWIDEVVATGGVGEGPDIDVNANENEEKQADTDAEESDNKKSRWESLEI